MAAISQSGLTGGARDPRHARKHRRPPGHWKRFLSPGSARKPGR